MKIYIGADHRGFQLKKLLLNYLKRNHIAHQDMGNLDYDKDDDYPDYAQKVAEAILQDKNSLGIVICGSGAGVSITANRYKNIQCVLGFNEKQVESAKHHDHCNILAIPSDYISPEKAENLMEIFINTSFNQSERYTNRLKKIN